MTTITDINTSNAPNDATHVDNNITYDKRSEIKGHIACLGIATIFGGLFIKDSMIQRANEQKKREALIIKGINAKELLHGRRDILGDPVAPYTLIEFGDYECPPCRGNQQVLHALLKQYADKLRLDFRHFPLVDLHPSALPAAIAAESARIDNQFWVAHNLLFQTDFSQQENLKKNLSNLGVKTYKDRALNQIKMDESLAKKLVVRGTPSFFLCCPDGRVLRLSGLESLEQYLK